MAFFWLDLSEKASHERQEVEQIKADIAAKQALKAAEVGGGGISQRDGWRFSATWPCARHADGRAGDRHPGRG